MGSSVETEVSYINYLLEHKRNIERVWNGIYPTLILAGLINPEETEKIEENIGKHDDSKFIQPEFSAYAAFFFGGRKNKREERRKRSYHKDSNKHYHRALKEYVSNDWKCYAVEMVCDWEAMGLVHGLSANEYYVKAKEEIELPLDYKSFVEEVLLVVAHLELEEEKEMNIGL